MTDKMLSSYQLPSVITSPASTGTSHLTIPKGGEIVGVSLWPVAFAPFEAPQQRWAHVLFSTGMPEWENRRIHVTRDGFYVDGEMEYVATWTEPGGFYHLFEKEYENFT